MEIQHATDLEIAKHLASHVASPTGKSKEQNRISKLLADRNARMKKAHVVQPMGLVYKEDRDENAKQEIADRLANTPAERAERKHRVQVAINKAKQLREGDKMKTFSQLKEAAAPASPALVSAMNSLLADNFAFYLKAHNYHWNIEGADFAQYHSFLGDLYEDVHGAVDNIAERIRTLKAYAIGTMENFMGETAISEDSSIPGPMQMLQNITMDNETLIESLTRAYKAAEADGRVGLANFLQDRIDAHEKHGWMLRSLVKGNLSESTELDEVNSRHSFVAAQARLTPRAKNVRDALTNTNRAKAATNKYGRVIGKIAGMKPKEVVANLRDMGEETEQIDELKKSTLASYITKASRQSSSLHSLGKEFDNDKRMYAQKALKARTPKTKEKAKADMEASGRLAKTFTRKAQNRTAGISRAAVKLAKEEVEQIDEAGVMKKVGRAIAGWGAFDKDKPKDVVKNTKSMSNDALSKIAATKRGSFSFKKSPAALQQKVAKRELEKRSVSEEVELDEVLKPSMGASAYIHDFVHSKNPKFAGKSKAERTKMALGAYYGAKKGK